MRAKFIDRPDCRHSSDTDALLTPKATAEALTTPYHEFLTPLTYCLAVNVRSRFDMLTRRMSSSWMPRKSSLTAFSRLVLPAPLRPETITMFLRASSVPSSITLRPR